MFVLFKVCVEYVRVEYDNVIVLILNCMLEGIKRIEIIGNYGYKYEFMFFIIKYCYFFLVLYFYCMKRCLF